MAAEQKKLEAIKQEALTKAASCLECGEAAGTDNEKDALWISCDACHYWFHGSCAEVTQDMLDLVAEHDSWECRNCWLERYMHRLSISSQCLHIAGPCSTVLVFSRAGSIRLC